MNEKPETPPVGMPFPCPNCGGFEWKADYYEAVWQGAVVTFGEGGTPEIIDYDGSTGSYDDGSSDNEALRCLGCDHEIRFGTFRLVEPVDLEALKDECEYHEDPDHENGDGSVDNMIAYKDALEDLVGRLTEQA